MTEAIDVIAVRIEHLGQMGVLSLNQDVYRLRHRRVSFVPDVPDCLDHFNQAVHLLRCGRIIQFSISRWVSSYHDRLAIVRHRLPKFFRHERHDWVEELQGLIQDVAKNVLGIGLFFCGPVIQLLLGHFNVPVTEVVPDKVVKRPTNFTEFKLL